MGLFLLHSALNSEEVYLDRINLILLLIWGVLDCCRQQEDVLGRSLEVQFDFCLILNLEEANRLPKLAMVVPCLFAAQPILIISLREVRKSLLGDMEPSGLIGREDQSLEDGKDPLESLVGAHHDYPLCEHFLGGVMSEGEVGLRVVGNIEV